MVIPSEFAELLNSEEVVLEMKNNSAYPTLIIKPKNALDSIEEDPLFALFIQALYKNAMENPEQLEDGSEIWNERVKKLIDGVDITDEE